MMQHITYTTLLVFGSAAIITLLVTLLTTYYDDDDCYLQWLLYHDDEYTQPSSNDQLKPKTRRRRLSSSSNNNNNNNNNFDDYRDPKSIQQKSIIEQPFTTDIWFDNLIPITIPPNNNDHDTVLFWMIPKSGTSTVKNVYQCMSLTFATREGHVYVNENENEDELMLQILPNNNAFGDAYLANVDTTTKEGILHAKKLSLVPSKLVHIISSGMPHFAVQHLYDNNTNRGRIIGLFRHPVERWMSRYYFSQKDSGYQIAFHPEWRDTTLLQFANLVGTDNVILRTLMGRYHVSLEDIPIAKRILRERFIVGLTSRMEETVHRFNLVLGIDDVYNEKNRECTSLSMSKSNANSHSKVKKL